MDHRCISSRSRFLRVYYSNNVFRSGTDFRPSASLSWRTVWRLFLADRESGQLAHNDPEKKEPGKLEPNVTSVMALPTGIAVTVLFSYEVLMAFILHCHSLLATHWHQYIAKVTS